MREVFCKKNIFIYIDYFYGNRFELYPSHE